MVDSCFRRNDSMSFPQSDKTFGNCYKGWKGRPPLPQKRARGGARMTRPRQNRRDVDGEFFQRTTPSATRSTISFTALVTRIWFGSTDPRGRLKPHELSTFYREERLLFPF